MRECKSTPLTARTVGDIRRKFAHIGVGSLSKAWFGVRVSYGDNCGHAAIARSSDGLMLSLAGLDRAPMSAAHA